MLAAWDGPVLVIHGEEDAFVPLAEARENLARLRNGTGTWIPGAGHLCNHEKPGEFNAAVSDFLRGRVLG
jgi:pimeloyl-ACP methyl ester carboxylesterase